MSNHTHLIGTEEVARAARTMAEAADSFRRSVEYLDQVMTAHAAHMEAHAARIEAAMKEVQP